MKYHAPTKGLTFEIRQLERASGSMLWAIASIRQAAGLPLGPRETPGPMKAPDFAEQGILDAAEALGIDLGESRYGRLDVSKYK